MARLFSIGFEIGLGSPGLEGVGTNGVTQTTVARSGSRAFKGSSGAGNTTSFWTFTPRAASMVVGRTHFVRQYIRFEQLPDLTTVVARASAGATALISVRLTSTGVLQFWNDVAGTQIGSDGPTVVVGRWNLIEYSININAAAGTDDVVECKGETISFATATAALSTVVPTTFSAGWITAPGANKDCYVDDFAINDSSDIVDKTYPGPGKLVLLLPTTDVQRGSWTGGAGGTTNLWDAINNAPPIGTATETNLTQIESADSTSDNSTDEYRVGMATYASAGITANDIVTVVHAVIDNGEDSATGTKTGSAWYTNYDVTVRSFTFGDDVGALGTWPTGWAAFWLPGVSRPNPNITDSPGLTIRKVTASTAVGSIDFVGMYAEYISYTFMPHPTKRYGANTGLRM